MAPDIARRIVARWDHPDPQYVPLLGQAGIQAVVVEAPNEPFARACEQAGIGAIASSELDFLNLKSAGRTGTKPVVFTEGQWPGAARSRDVAAASSGPWVDANLHWMAYLRALYPGRPAVLGYLPPQSKERLLPFDALELALVEAWVMGGNYLLALEPAFREALFAGDARARAAWERLGRTAAFLRAQQALFGGPVTPALTLLVEPGEATPEIANLLYRRCLSPALAPAADPPAPDAARILVLAAVDIQPPSAAVRRRILAHAEAGATVVVNGTWWRGAPVALVRGEEDRDVYHLGRGSLVAYKGAIEDPGAFGYDVIDLVGQERRAARLWNADAAIAVASGRKLYCVNYGNYGRGSWGQALARVPAHYGTARLLSPDGGPQDLKTARRGSGTEVNIQTLRRLAVVVFE